MNISDLSYLGEISVNNNVKGGSNSCYFAVTVVNGEVVNQESCGCSVTEEVINGETGTSRTYRVTNSTGSNVSVSTTSVSTSSSSSFSSRTVVSTKIS